MDIIAEHSNLVSLMHNKNRCCICETKEVEMEKMISTTQQQAYLISCKDAHHSQLQVHNVIFLKLLIQLQDWGTKWNKEGQDLYSRWTYWLRLFIRDISDWLRAHLTELELSELVSARKHRVSSADGQKYHEETSNLPLVLTLGAHSYW